MLLSCHTLFYLITDLEDFVIDFSSVVMESRSWLDLTLYCCTVLTPTAISDSRFLLAIGSARLPFPQAHTPPTATRRQLFTFDDHYLRTRTVADYLYSTDQL